MDAVWLAAIPTLLAVVLWAIADLQRFALFAVLPAMIAPTTLADPAGAQLALADLLLLVALGGWLIAWSVRAERGAQITNNDLLLPALLFVFANLASLAWSDKPHDTFAFVIQLIEITVVFPLLFASVPQSLRVIRQGLSIFGLIACGLAIWTFAAFVPEAAAGNLTGTYVAGLHKNAIGTFLAAAFILAYAFWLVARGSARFPLLLASAVTAAGLFASVSRGAILGALAASVLVSLLLRRKRVLTLALVALATVGSVATVGPEARSERKQAGGYESSVVREYSFPNAVEKIRADPVLGTGAGTYEDEITQLDIGLKDPNNMFLLTWAEVGLLGMAALLFLLFAFGRLLWRVSRLSPDAAVIGVAAGGVGVTVLVHAQVDITWTRGTSTIGFAMMGLMLAAQRLATPAPASPPESRHSEDAAPGPRPRQLVGAS